LINTYQEVLVGGKSSKDKEIWQGRTDAGKIVNFKSEKEIKPGDMVNVYIESTSPWALSGREIAADDEAVDKKSFYS